MVITKTLKKNDLHISDEIHKNYANAFYEIEMHSVYGSLEQQEDKVECLLKPGSTILTICDGMGGLQKGSLAAETAVSTIYSLAETMEWETNPILFLNTAIDAADLNVCSLFDYTGKRINAGCTLVLVLLIGNCMYWANVGDSRLYYYHDDILTQLSEDHNYKSLLNEKKASGMLSEEEYLLEMKRGAALTSHLGIGGVRKRYVCRGPIRIQQNDVIMLLSDGLYRLVNKELTRTIIHKNLKKIECTAKELLNSAEKKRKDYQDNTSILLARLK